MVHAILLYESALWQDYKKHWSVLVVAGHRKLEISIKMTLSPPVLGVKDYTGSICCFQ